MIPVHVYILPYHGIPTQSSRLCVVYWYSSNSPIILLFTINLLLKEYIILDKYDVTVSLQALSQDRTFLAMFRPGLCLKLLFYVLLRLHPILL